VLKSSFIITVSAVFRPVPTSSTESISRDDPHYSNLPVSHANAILGVADPDGSFSTFADCGDSGSLITRMTPDEDGAEVVTSEGIGILYATVWEDLDRFSWAYISRSRVSFKKSSGKRE
jgi:hypothetical protein